VSFIALWGLLVALECSIQIFIGVWVEQEIRGRETCWVRIVPVLDCVGVEEFSGVVGAVPSILEPDWEPIGVESLGDKFGVSAF
jgi:hypothetical protein